MNESECKRIANGIAYRFVQQAIDTGDDSEQYAPEDRARIDIALDAIAQRLYERSHLAERAPRYGS